MLNMGTMKSILLTTIQFATLGIILFTNAWPSGQPVLAGIQALGLLLGIWAILVMSRSKLNITPVPRKGAFLVESGPYRLLRHPMYTSLMLIVLPSLYDNHSPLNIFLTGVLFINLYFKLMYEEQLLQLRFEGYIEFRKRTWRLIPWIW